MTTKKVAVKTIPSTITMEDVMALLLQQQQQAVAPAKATKSAKAEVVKGSKVPPKWYEGKSGKSLSIDGQDDYVLATLESGEKIRLVRKFKGIVAYKA
jgi:hypothetical protein